MPVVKIALIGAGSRSFGPSSIKDVLLSEPLAELGVELVLMDTVAEHLKDSDAYARRVAEKLERRTSITATAPPSSPTPRPISPTSTPGCRPTPRRSTSR